MLCLGSFLFGMWWLCAAAGHRLIMVVNRWIWSCFMLQREGLCLIKIVAKDDNCVMFGGFDLCLLQLFGRIGVLKHYPPWYIY